MKFKSKEELIKEVNNNAYNSEYAVELTFQSFAERIEFYKKYKDSRMKLMTDYPKIYEEFVSYVVNTFKNNVVRKEQLCNLDLFNGWLFDHCFGGI